MQKNRWQKLMLLFLAVPFFLLFVLQIDSYARIGGGRSSGFRGSRTYSSPTRTAPLSPSSPSRSYQQPGTPYQQPSGGGFFRGMMGGLAGGMLGSMLFRGLGFGGGDWGGGGIGLFDILLLALILYLIYRFVKKRREQAMQNAYYQSGAYGAATSGSYEQPYGAGSAGASREAMDTEAGLRYIRQTDPAFDETRFRDACLDAFFTIQGAWANRDMSALRNLLTDEMYRTIQGDADRLRADKQINKLDNIAVRTTEITEAWQESGSDCITVRFYANLLDYTVDETTGQVISGSKSDPVKFEEYWTFTRPVGSNPWQLSAIQQAQ
jgi:predicted lipid-binding transport protein (Tim44 family)